MQSHMQSQRGFSVLELMVVMVIAGIITALAIPNFAVAQDRARNTAVKANMYKVQTALETYGIDWDGKYPRNLQRLKREAQGLTTETESYWSSFKNPFTSASGFNFSMRNFNVRGQHVRTNNTVKVNNSSEGMVVYDTNPYYRDNPKVYAIYGVDNNGEILSVNGYPFCLSNS